MTLCSCDYALESITLPSTLVDIGVNAFWAILGLRESTGGSNEWGY